MYGKRFDQMSEEERQAIADDPYLQGLFQGEMAAEDERQLKERQRGYKVGRAGKSFEAFASGFAR